MCEGVVSTGLRWTLLLPAKISVHPVTMERAAGVVRGAKEAVRWVRF